MWMRCCFNMFQLSRRWKLWQWGITTRWSSLLRPWADLTESHRASSWWFVISDLWMMNGLWMMVSGWQKRTYWIPSHFTIGHPWGLESEVRMAVIQWFRCRSPSMRRSQCHHLHCHQGRSWFQWKFQEKGHLQWYITSTLVIAEGSNEDVNIPFLWKFLVVLGKSHWSKWSC